MLLAILYALVNQYAVVRGAELVDVPILAAWIAGLPGTVAQAFALFVAAWIAGRVQRRFDPQGASRGVYLLCLLLTDALFSVARFFIVEQRPESALLVGARDYLSLLIVSALFGIAGERLADQVRRTEEALLVVESQRGELLVADERARQEVARYLHDSVQSDLVVIAMQLRSQAGDMPPESAERINSVIDELEKVRLLDIRAASRRLSPDIEALGLSGALRQLANGYSPTMAVVVECPFALPGTGPDHLLAVYRIAEQALLNAAVHGQAHSCSITVSLPSADQVRLAVINDGLAPSDVPQPGAGSAIIEAWVSRYAGTWSLKSGGQSTALVATIKWDADAPR
ncbi:MAG: sensor histidine kinase [bacterium]